MEITKPLDHTGPLFNQQESNATNKEVVRVLPTALARPKDIFTILGYQSVGDLDSDLNNLWFTQSTWIVDGESANEYLMLPGGEIKEDRKLKCNEGMKKAAKREVWEELHLPHIQVSDRLISTRSYSFGNGQNERKEYNMFAEVPPFVTATNGEEGNRIAHITLVNPDELKELFEEEAFRNTPLLDSLINLTSDDIVADPQENEEFKDNTLGDALDHELTVRRKVFARFLINRMGSEVATPSYIEQLFEQDQDPDAAQEIQNLNTRFAEMIKDTNTGTYQDFLAELQVSSEEVYFDESVRYVEESGPQASYLLGQVILDYSTITPFEMERMQEVAPELYAFYSSIAEAYATDTSDPHWYQLAKDNIRRLRNIKTKPFSQKTDEDIEEVKSSYTAFEQSFLGKLGITDRKKIANYSKRTDDFLVSLQQAFANSLDRQTASEIFSNKIYTTTSSLEELLYISLGFSPYTENEDFDMDSPQGTIPCWQALRKIIGISQMPEIEELHAEIIARNIHPLRKAFKAAISTKSEVDITTTPFVMQKTNLRNARYANVENHNTESESIPVHRIDLRDVPLLYTVAEKPFESIVRKIIERADLRNGNKAEQIDDVLRFAIIADSEKITHVKTDSGKKEISVEEKDIIGKETLRHLLSSTLLDLTDNAGNITIRKVKSSGVMNEDSVIPNQKVSVLETVVANLRRQYKSRLDGLTIENGKHNGSGASIDQDQPSWNWLKLVIEVDGVPCELQLYPSVTDYLLKLDDDPRYGIERLQTIHGEDRFPVDVVLFEREQQLKNNIIRTVNGKNGSIISSQ